MSMTEWAEREIAAACKRENPNWDGKSFDYGCSCYQSALKAYNSLISDGHSGFSFSITRNILKKLLDEIPLSPITDSDFFINEGESIRRLETDESLRKRGLKSHIQCPRRSSLFREEDLEGNIKYRDIERYYCINAENPSDTFSSSIDNFIDKLYPITMPYIPSSERFKVYIKYWLTDKSHGDFDVQEVIGYKDQEGKWHDYSEFIYHDGNGLLVITDEDIKQKLRERRLTSIEDNIATNVFNNIKDIFLPDDLWRNNRIRYNKIKNVIDKVIKVRFSYVSDKCRCLVKQDEHGICYLNTYDNIYTLVNRSDEYKEPLIKECDEVRELIEVINMLKEEIDILIHNDSCQETI